MYNALILDHFNRPRNLGTLQGARRHRLLNRACGDQIDVTVNIGKDGRIEDIKWSGRGCAITMASASMMSEALKGATGDEAAAVRESVMRLIRNEPGDYAHLGDLRALDVVHRYPLRANCAALPWGFLDVVKQTEKEVTA